MGGLDAKLRAARKRRRWSITDAVRRMPGVGKSTLWTLEGSNKDRPSSPGEMKLRTAVAIASAYYPEISLKDLMGPNRCLLAFKPRENKARRALKELGYVPPSGPTNQHTECPG